MSNQVETKTQEVKDLCELIKNKYPDLIDPFRSPTPVLSALNAWGRFIDQIGVKNASLLSCGDAILYSYGSDLLTLMEKIAKVADMLKAKGMWEAIDELNYVLTNMRDIAMALALHSMPKWTCLQELCGDSQ